MCNKDIILVIIVQSIKPDAIFKIKFWYVAV